ncbi:MAG: rhodanese-like domain-containing protein [Propionibacteriaceae bacterium]|nr:rhodanese-like domain-containing protein [Propionibacteriaceae bacterium]
MHAGRTSSIATLAVAAALTVAGCAVSPSAGPAGPAAPTGPGGSQPTAAAPAMEAGPAYGAALDADTFAASLETPNVTVIDVRSPAEYAEGHLEGAILADINGDFATAMADLDRSAPYAVYCRSGNRSAAALDAMKEMGFTDAWHLDGGIGAWEAAGHEVVAEG